jgi:hypothetical protein
MPSLILLILITHPAVVLHNDSLIFMTGQQVRGVRILSESTTVTPDGGTLTRTSRAKVASDSQYALLFEESRFLPRDSFSTRVTLYSAGQRKIRAESGSGNRRIAYDLTCLFADTILLGTVGLDYTRPRLELIPPRGARKTVIPDSLFTRIIQQIFSPNRRYVVLHARKPSGTRALDVIFAKDRETGFSWEYLFPICLTCRRSTIDLSVDDQGRVEAVYKNEHRIFSPTGEMTDLFMKIE